MSDKYPTSRRSFLHSMWAIPSAVYAVSKGGRASASTPDITYQSKSTTAPFAVAQKVSNSGYAQAALQQPTVAGLSHSELEKRIVNTNPHDLFAQSVLDPRVQVLDAADMGNGIIKYHILAQSPGYLDRETFVYGDIGGSLHYDEGLIPDDPQLVALMTQTTRRTPNPATGEIGTIRYREKPVVFISLDEGLLKGATINPEDVEIVKEYFTTEHPKWNNGFSTNTDIQVGKIVDNPHLIVPSAVRGNRVRDGYVIIRFDNEIPGIGSVGVWNENSDGYINSSIIRLRTGLDKEILSAVLAQEGISAYGAQQFPDETVFGPYDTILHEGTQLRTFAQLDLNHGHWLYSRPANNRHPDKDDGFPLDVAAIPVTGDFDGDRKVGFPDFLGFAQHFGTNTASSGWDARYDLDNDGQVGFSDFLTFAQNFGRERTIPHQKPVGHSRSDAHLMDLRENNPAAFVDTLLATAVAEQPKLKDYPLFKRVA